MIDQIAAIISTAFVSIFSWILSLIGIIAAPVIKILSVSPILFLGVTVVITYIALYLTCANDRTKVTLASIDWEIMINIPFIHASFLLGYFSLMCGNSEFYDTMLWYKGITEFPMLFNNYEQWAFYAKFAFVIVVLGFPVLMYVYGRRMGILGIIREATLLFSVCMIGMILSCIRVFFLTQFRIYFLRTIIGFFWTIAEGVSLAEIYITLALPVVVIYNKPNLLAAPSGFKTSHSESHSTRSDFSSYDDMDSTCSIPTYVADDDGNHYPVEIRGDFLYIIRPEGSVSIKWEYVKGDTYFYVDGTRYYPH